MDYQIGQQIEMDVIGIQVDSAGYNFIALTYKDDPARSFRVYNILKCQYESLPKTLYVLVKSVEAFGRKIKLRQDEGRLYREHYAVGKFYAFEIVELREDQNKKTFYVIEDDFASHRYYYQGEATHKVGDDVILEIDGFNEDGFLKFKSREESSSDVPVEVAKPMEAPDNTQNQLTHNNNWNQLPVLDVPDEGETIELKTSIAFPPDANWGEANIDKQLKNIIKELAAFMNTEGGTLYIGVHDKTKKVVGIEGDYAHLNDGDDYSGTYSANNDGYQLKIRNTMDRLCQGFANSRISFDFLSLEGHTYCKITAKKAKRPVFVLGTQLYVRQGNRVKQLKADDITNYIYEQNLYEQMVLENLMDIEKWRKIFQEAFPDRRVPENLPPLKKNDEVDYWIVWYHNSEWMRVREQQDLADDIAFQLPVYKNMGDSIVVFCYATGCVNTVMLSNFKAGANLNRLQSGGWCRNSKPKNIFLMRPGDFLVGYSIDGHGASYVKLHAITDFRSTQAATNQGSRFIPMNGAQIQAYAVLESHHRPKIEGLIVPQQRKTQELGAPLNTQNHERSAEIEFLGNILSGR